MIYPRVIYFLPTRVIADAVINHMTGRPRKGKGTGGSLYVGSQQNYTGVPYAREHFHDPCPIINGKNMTESRNCMLVGLNDLNQTKEYVRVKIADYLNDMIEIGVKGFRVDASKHIWPKDLKAIWSLLKDLPDGNRPFFIHEVTGPGAEYFELGQVTEFKYGSRISQFIKQEKFHRLKNIYSPKNNMADSHHATVFIDNHDKQRKKKDILNAASPTHNDRLYKIATAFMLSYDYGFKRIMSSYYFTFDTWTTGPPSIDPEAFPKPCGNGWTCEHRLTSSMKFR